jgi:2-polyprenyl-3-methyl-5-hydroxy-6-metoxy-1,4-benzoquinol methylase
MKRKVKYLVRSLLNIFQKQQCPYCNGTNLEALDRKFLITKLVKCKQCSLNHRHPKDSSKYLNKFYQKEYQIDVGMMTDLPSDKEILSLKEEGFKSERDLSKYTSLLFETKTLNIVDYGCSWGYNVFKLQSSGHNAIGFEISKPRAQFGEKNLGVKIYSELNEVPSTQDLFLSSHVIEHLIDLTQFFKYSQEKLTPNGIFMAFCPNGNAEYRQRDPNTWTGSWGDLHVNLIDIAFVKNAFKNNPYLILSGDWDYDLKVLREWDGVSQKVGNIKDGKELLVIAKPNVNL